MSEVKKRKLSFVQAMRRLGQQMTGWEKAFSEMDAQLPLITKLYLRNGLILKMTCSACPEQYDVFEPRGKQVAYLRLRHGHFTVSYPECGGKLIYQSCTNGDGTFDANERFFHLAKALRAIRKATE